MGLVESVVAHEGEKLAGEALAGATAGPGGAILAFLKDHWKAILCGIAAVVIAVAVASHIANDRHTRKERDGLLAWQTAVVAATGTGVGHKVKTDDIVANIQWLASERVQCATELGTQSTALNDAKRRATAAQNNAVEAQNRAAQRDKDLQATRAALRDPKRSTGLTAAEWGKL